MANANPIAAQLQHALDLGVLPPDRRLIGQRLIQQLTSAPRIAVMGLPGAGKTSLISMMVGAPVMPALEDVPVLELRHGATARLSFELADGRSFSRDGLAAEAAFPPGVVRVIQEAPVPALKTWSFLEVGLAGKLADQGDLLAWAAARSDIVIWCSQQFDATERALWAQMPDALKDHSFLVLTKADQLYLKRELGERIAELQPTVAEEFLALYPVATKQAIASRAVGPQGDAALWHSSGGKAFLDGVRQQVDQARMADLDHASLFLDHCRLAGAAMGAAAPLPQQPIPAEPAPTRPAAPPAAPATADGTAAVIDKALGLLQDCAEDLAAAGERPGGIASERILDRCTAIAEDLIALLSDQEDGSAALIDLQDDAVEGEQMLLLLRLERGQSASADALTVLLQLKKEMAERALA